MVSLRAGGTAAAQSADIIRYRSLIFLCSLAPVLAKITRVAPFPRMQAGRSHLIVCGDDALTSRMVEELAVRYGERVTVILPSARGGHGPTLARLSGVQLIERAELDQQAFLDARVQSARALAILHQDDLGNFHAALRAQELNPPACCRRTS
jgi:hypothetical protein